MSQTFVPLALEISNADPPPAEHPGNGASHATVQKIALNTFPLDWKVLRGIQYLAFKAPVVFSRLDSNWL